MFEGVPSYPAFDRFWEVCAKHKITHFYNQIVDIYVYTKVENTADRINKFAELKIGIPGDDVVVKKTAKSFEEAINTAADAAERILKKRKEKQRP